jgi:hypothetical protein
MQAMEEYGFSIYDQCHHLAERATLPIGPRGRTLAALLLLAGRCPARRRAWASAPHRRPPGASNYLPLLG